MGGAYDVVVGNAGLSGGLAAIASKSVAHRLLILAATSARPVSVRCATTSRDIEATVGGLRSLGAVVERRGEALDVTPGPRGADGGLPARLRGATLDCGESGSTLRFMLPVACALGADATLDGSGRLPRRPLSPLRELIEEHGCALSAPGTWPVRASGRMAGGRFELRGDVSSQFVTGLLLALSAGGQGGEVDLVPPVESRPYIDVTVDALRRFGVDVRTSPDGLSLRVGPGSLPEGPEAIEVEGDWSNAAFWMAAGAIGDSPIRLSGLRADSPQGDRAVCEVLERFGARVELDASAGSVRVSPAPLRGIELDAADIPDLAVPMAVVAACASGVTHVSGAGRLRAKESDRLASVTAMLRALGVEVREGADDLLIRGVGSPSGAAGAARVLAPCRVDACNDHRIAMAAAVAATRARGPVRVVGAQAVEKSYPTFFEDFRRLGGDARVVPAGAGEGGEGR